MGVRRLLPAILVGALSGSLLSGCAGDDTSVADPPISPAAAVSKDLA